MWNRKLKSASMSSRGSSSCTREMDADFISQLPDHLLLHIFSFLDETVVFQSSVLSKRWRYLWTLVPFPTAIKELRSYVKKAKAVIRKKKLSEEEEARNTLFKLTFEVVRAIIQCLLSAGTLVRLEFRMFVVFNLTFTLSIMFMMCSAFYLHYSSLSYHEVDLKRLQMDDSWLTSHANSLSTTKVPMAELLFPENYEPRYVKSAKVYGLTGILVMVMISCGAIVLKLNFDFTHGIGPWIAILSNFGNVGFWVFLLIWWWGPLKLGWDRCHNRTNEEAIPI